MRLLFLVILCSFSSCNIVKKLTGEETDIPRDFGNNYNNENDGASSLYNGLFGFWRLDESISLDRLDTSTSGRHFTDTTSAGLPNASGHVGNGVNCAGASSGSTYLDHQGSWQLGPLDDFAFSFWVNKSGNNATDEYIFYSDQLKIFFKEGVIPSDDDLIIEYSGNTTSFVDIINFNSGDFEHFVVNISGGGSIVSLFVNDIALTDESGISGSISSLYFGLCSDLAGVYGLQGVLDSFGMWNRLLTRDEITRLYNGSNPLD